MQQCAEQIRHQPSKLTRSHFSLQVQFLSAVPIDGMMAESGLKHLLAKEAKYLIRLPLVQIQFIPPTYTLCMSENQML